MITSISKVGRDRMNRKLVVFVVCSLSLVIAVTAWAQGRGGAQSQTTAVDESIKSMVGRLDLEKYKATIKGLTQFGDRRQGTERNRKAVDWIEAQLKSYGCPTERIKYEYSPTPNAQRGG